MKVFFYWARLAWFIFLIVNIWFFGARARASSHEVTFDRLFPENSYEQLLSITIIVYNMLQDEQLQHDKLQAALELLTYRVNGMNRYELSCIKAEDMNYLALLIEQIYLKCQNSPYSQVILNS